MQITDYSRKKEEIKRPLGIKEGSEMAVVATTTTTIVAYARHSSQGVLLLSAKNAEQSCAKQTLCQGVSPETPLGAPPALSTRDAMNTILSLAARRAASRPTGFASG